MPALTAVWYLVVGCVDGLRWVGRHTGWFGLAPIARLWWLYIWSGYAPVGWLYRWRYNRYG